MIRVIPRLRVRLTVRLHKVGVLALVAGYAIGLGW